MTYAVKAAEIPQVQQEYTDIWNLEKQFYNIPPLSDTKYWDYVLEEVYRYYEKHHTPHAKGLAVNFLEELERRSKELYGESKSEVEVRKVV